MSARSKNGHGFTEMLPNAWTLFIVSVVAFASNWQFGYQITYINTASATFSEFANKYYRNATASANVTISYEEWSNEWSFIVSSFYPGTFVGFVMVPYLIRRVGVRRSLLLSSYPSIIGCILQFFNRVLAEYSLMTFVASMSIGRILVGFQAGCSLCLLPLFIIETAPIDNRPFLSSLQEVFQALSTLLGLMIGTIPFDVEELEWFQVIAVIPMCLFIGFLLFLPDTPLFLLEVRLFGDGKNANQRFYIITDDAFNESNRHFEHEFYKSVSFYHGSVANVATIREEMIERWSIEMNDRDRGMSGSENVKGIIIGSLAGISLAFTADDVIDSYSSQLFHHVEDPNAIIGEGGYSVPMYMQVITILLGFWLFVTSIFGAFLIDRFGRKRLIIAGLFGSALSNLVAVYGANVSSVLIMTIGFIFTKSFIGFGAGGPAWFMTSELVSPKVTCTAQSISTGLLLLMIGLVTLLFLPLEHALGTPGSLLMLSVLPSFLISMLLIVFLPETKDRSYENIRRRLASRFFSGLGNTDDGADEDDEEWQRSIGNNFNPSGMSRNRHSTAALVESLSVEGRLSSLRPSSNHKYQRLMSASSYASYGSLHNYRT